MKDTGWGQVQKEMRKFSKGLVKVGVLGKSGQDIVNRAVWNEYGTVDEDGDVLVPERPFIRTAIDENKGAIARRLAGSVRLILAGKSDADTQLQRIGAYVQGLIRKKISQIQNPHLADSTVRRKKSEKPLIDTGQMRQAVNYEVKHK